MAWPDSALTTYVTSDVPAVKGSDLNDFQSAIGQTFGATLGSSWYGFVEDFEGPFWSNTVPAYSISGVSGTTNFATTPYLFGKFKIDHTVSGVGNMDLDATTSVIDGTPGHVMFKSNGANGHASLIFPNAYNIGTRDFDIAARVRVVTRANIDTPANKGAFIGNNDSTAGQQLNLVGGSGAAPATKWQFQIGSSTLVDSGVTLTDNTFYWYQARRRSGQLSIYINGTLCYGPTTFSTSLTAFVPRISCFATTTGSGVERMTVDCFKIAFARP